jgi:hypothetical protein
VPERVVRTYHATISHKDLGEGYGQAILDSYGGPPPGDLDLPAAGKRLRCYQNFGADLPPGRGRPALTP